MNIDNINKLIDRIKKDQGHHLLMTNWATNLDDRKFGAFYYKHCNTAFCLAGHCAMLRALESGKTYEEMNRLPLAEILVPLPSTEGIRVLYSGSFLEQGRYYLGIDELNSNKLFLMQGPLRHSMADFDSLPRVQRSIAAVSVLEHLRDTGIVDWDRAIDRAKAEEIKDAE